MDLDEPESGGSTPVQDEPNYSENEAERPVTPGGSDSGPQGIKSMSDDEEDGEGYQHAVTADDDYVSDGGEVEREEVQQEVEDDDVEREMIDRSVDQDSDAEMIESGSAPGSPVGSIPRSRSGSASPQRSLSGSPPASPAGSAAGSPRSKSGTPPGSPARSRSGSPAGSARSRSGSPAGSAKSRSGSPAGSVRSRSGSPARSRSGSPAGSARSGSPAGSVRSRSGSPAGSARSRSGSPAGSARSRSGSPAGSARSRSGSAQSRRSRSRSGSVGSRRSRSRNRSVSGSPRSPRSDRGGSDKENDEDRRMTVDSEGEENDQRARKTHGSDEEAKKGGDDESDKESVADELIADIFGSSDEDEEFEGFGEADVEAPSRKDKKKATIASDEEGEGDRGSSENKEAVPELSDDENEDALRQSSKEDFVSDFELMLMRRKEENQARRRKRKDCDMINDNDDLIADLIQKMKQAAEEDRELNRAHKAATKKMKFLPFIAAQLNKSDLHMIFLDSGILSAITEWLAPLPDRSLPHYSIRKSLLHILGDFPTGAINADNLRNSGIGKAVMYLYKHPKETRENKEKAGKLINEWSRPIFNLTSNYSLLSREEREQRDYEQLPKKRRITLEGGQTPRRDIDRALTGDQKALRPGDPGWVYRARVPAPSNRDYVVRPKSSIEYVERKGSGKKEKTRYEKHALAFKEKKKTSKVQRAVAISIEGRKMAL